MAKYYFDLWDGNGVELDDMGSEFHDVKGAEQEAVRRSPASAAKHCATKRKNGSPSPYKTTMDQRWRSPPPSG
jgi:hypothetical protein